MKVDGAIKEDHANILTKLLQKDRQEQQATATITTEILSKLNISIDDLPHKCQELLRQTATDQAAMDIEQLDPIALFLQQSHQISEKFNQEYEILKLNQKNIKLQTEIDRNNRFLEDLKKDLESSRDSLASQTPNPENIPEHIKQMKQKLGSYEETYKHAMMKFSNLSVPDSVLPKSLQAQLCVLNALRDEAATWRQKADDVLFIKDARNTFSRLRR